MQQVLWARGLAAGLVLGTLAACQPGSGPFAGGDAPSTALTGEAVEAMPIDGAAAPGATSVRLVDRDVEAPEVFQVSAEALWDGRPSLGGVWVASPDARDPERVILRNPANGKFVIGALFRRERDNPGPPLQISSDAADALGILAGQPAVIDVTALRREEVALTAPEAGAPLLDSAETIAAETTEALAATGEETNAETDEAPAAAEAPQAEVAPEATPAPAPQPATGGGLIQIGIFSIESNARKTVETLAKAGVAAEITQETVQGKVFWSVIARGDKATLAKVRDAGFADAYFLKL
jgi:cell division septation protein DedD